MEQFAKCVWATWVALVMGVGGCVSSYDIDPTADEPSALTGDDAAAQDEDASPPEHDAGAAAQDAGEADGDAHEGMDEDAGEGEDAGGSDAGTDAAVSPFGAVYALIQAHCVSCHGAGKALDMSTPELARAELIGVQAEYKACASAAGTPKVRVVAGDPAGSLLIEKLSPTPSCGKAMPPGGMLSDAEVALFRNWIAEGAGP